MTRIRKRSRWAGIAACAGVLGVLTPAPAEEALRVVVTTAMIGSAVDELAMGERVEVDELIPPGSCPGHFDLTPATMKRLRHAGLLIHHDFQDGLVKKLGHQRGKRLRIETSGSLTLPANFLELVRKVAAGLEPHLDEKGRARLAKSLAGAQERLGGMDAEMKAAAKRWRGRAVVVSVMQRQFVEALGMKVVGELKRPEQLSPREWQKLAAAGPELIVGNLQSDAPAAEALGRRSGRPVAVLSNFPGADGYGRGFDGLLRANLARIEQATENR